MNCFLCGNSQLTLLSTQVRDGSGNVFLCETCDLGILEQGYSEDLNAFYDDEYRKLHGPKLGVQTSYQGFFDTYVGYQQERLDLLKPHLKPSDRLLEVGCATGYLLYHLKQRVGEVIGVDFDSEAAAFASKVCDCVTFGTGLEQSGLAEKSFDVICAFQTLEHVPDPVLFLKMLGRYLKEDGKLVIEVPNLHDPLISLYDNEKYKPFYYHKAHLFYFSGNALTHTLQQAGFTGQVHYAQDYNFLNHLHWTLLNQPQVSCDDGLGKPRLPFAKQLSEKARHDMESWLDETGRHYKKVLSENQLTDNITFIGGFSQK